MALAILLAAFLLLSSLAGTIWFIQRGTRFSPEEKRWTRIWQLLFFCPSMTVLFLVFGILDLWNGEWVSSLRPFAVAACTIITVVWSTLANHGTKV